MLKSLTSFNFVLRAVVFVFIMTFGIAFLFLGTKQALAADLRNISVIEGSVMKAGDIFRGLTPEKAAFVLGPAPLPGDDMVLGTAMLMRISRALDLQWRPSSMSDQVTIRRAATLVSNETIEEIVREKLQESGVTEQFNLKFHGTLRRLILPADQPAIAEIISFNYNSQSDRFEANIAAPSAANPLSEIIISGKIERLIQIPVLKKALRNGDLIGKYDIVWLEIPVRKLQHDILLQEEHLFGMTPRRMVKAGRPVRANELEAPLLVARGDIVTIIFENDLMSLSANGRALQSGTKGDIIRIVNIASNRSIEAIVADNRVVMVQP